MVLTMAAVAAHKGIHPTRLGATVEGRTQLATDTRTHFASEIDLGEGLTPREERILFNAARQCEVHKMLHGTVTFEERRLEPSLPLHDDG
ncbi:MAG TPA: hypothetical protein PKO09_18125 [Anaerolineae bacterium]|jgi:uncharacterized OsmC-like protein|nr:hypothetical protein [Anaerolineae bacterium]